MKTENPNHSDESSELYDLYEFLESQLDVELVDGNDCFFPLSVVKVIVENKIRELKGLPPVDHYGYNETSDTTAPRCRNGLAHFDGEF